MSEKNKVILEEANAAVASGDYKKFLSFCADETEWVFLGDRILRGKQAVYQWMIATYLQPPKNTVRTLIAEGDFVMALGDIGVVNLDGTTTYSHYCDVWRFHNGKMLELRAFVVETDSQSETIDWRKQ